MDIYLTYLACNLILAAWPLIKFSDKPSQLWQPVEWFAVMTICFLSFAFYFFWIWWVDKLDGSPDDSLAKRIIFE